MPRRARLIQEDSPTSIQEDPRGLELAFAVMAHEMAHQWWGIQLAPALSRELRC